MDPLTPYIDPQAPRNLTTLQTILQDFDMIGTTGPRELHVRLYRFIAVHWGPNDTKTAFNVPGIYAQDLY